MALSQILPSLFLSSASEAANAPLVSRSGITLIINATLCHAPAPPPGVEVLRVPVSDLPTARLDRHFDRVAERIHGNRAGNTLVHCAAGVSRSPTLVMAYLMRFRGATLSQAHALVRDKRPHVCLNRGFWEQLLSYERRLYGRNSVRLAEEEREGPLRGQSFTQPRPQTGNGPMRGQSFTQPRPQTGNGPMRGESFTQPRPQTGNGPMRGESFTQPRPQTGNGPMRGPSFTQPRPQAGNGPMRGPSLPLQCRR